MAHEAIVLLWLIISLFALISLMLAYLVVRKMAENRKTLRRAVYIEQYRKPVYDYLLSGIETRSILPHGRKSKEEALETLLQQCASLFGGVETAERIRTYASRFLTARYRRNLRSRKWSVRVNTLYRVEKFDMRHMTPDLEAIAAIGGLKTEERALVYKLLAEWGVKKFIGMLIREGADFSEHQNRLIFSRMSQELFVDTMRRFEHLPASLQYTVIDVIGILRQTEFYAELSLMTKDDDTEIRIRALKALGQFDFVPPDPGYIRHASAATWQERMMAAKLFGKIRDRFFVPELIRLLGDEVWFVRSQSAQSLLACPDGPSALKSAAASSSDRFAREMAAEWLEKGEYTHGLG